MRTITGKYRVYPRHQQCPAVAARNGSCFTSCSGCYESNEGYPPAGAERHPKHGCYLGAGCHECQGRGFVRTHFPVPYENRETGKEDFEALEFGDW